MITPNPCVVLTLTRSPGFGVTFGGAGCGCTELKALELESVPSSKRSQGELHYSRCSTMLSARPSAMISVDPGVGG